MPGLDIAQFIPLYPLHWTTILHYLLLIGTIALLTLAGDKSSILYTFVLAFLALLIGVDLYSNLIRIPRLFIFLVRIAVFGIPVIIAGMGANEQSRSVAGITAVIALPLLVLTFISCWLGPTFGDPRIIGWC